MSHNGGASVSVPLICSHCLSVLELQPEQAICPKCHTVWPRRSGVISIGDPEAQYWGEISQVEMRKVLGIAREQGWRVATQEYLRLLHPYTYRYSCDESRVDWRFLLPITKQSRVLDFGCGWGAISWALARIAGYVVSVDSTFERVAFLEEKRRQEGVEHILPLFVASMHDLPFAHDSFDLIVLNGVLEWIPEGETEKRPIDAQKFALRRFNELLRPGGVLYIGIENRYGYNYFLGSPDHNGLPFTGLMPRRVADMVSRRVLKRPYRTLTHSHSGYKRLLSSAGFKVSEYWWLIPQYREPQYALPLDEPEIVSYYLDHIFVARTFGRRMFRSAARILNSSQLLKSFAPDFGIIAVKE